MRSPTSSRRSFLKSTAALAAAPLLPRWRGDDVANAHVAPRWRAAFAPE